jgi:hypothetical protein
MSRSCSKPTLPRSPGPGSAEGGQARHSEEVQPHCLLCAMDTSTTGV